MRKIIASMCECIIMTPIQIGLLFSESFTYFRSSCMEMSDIAEQDVNERCLPWCGSLFDVEPHIETKRVRSSAATSRDSIRQEISDILR